MTSYYVDALAGNDTNDGLSANQPLRTLSKVQDLLEQGDVVNLKRGSVWHDDLYITDANVTIKGYGTGANPLLDGDHGSRVGIVVAAAGARIEGIDVTSASNGIYITGTGASATVIGGTFSLNGTGIVAGGGGRLVLADGVTATGSVRSLGAGDGIQISQDASSGVHTIINSNLSNNATAGVNAKAGTVLVTTSQLAFNGEPGWIAQNDVNVFKITNSIIKGNNQSDNGTGQASIEDHATVFSTGNIYENPANGNKATVQINMISTKGALYSDGDTFINDSGQNNTIGSIRVNTGAAPAIVSVVHADFEHGRGSGIAIDGYGATNLSLTVEDSTFNMGDTRAIRLNPGSVATTHLSGNDFSRADAGTVLEIQDRLFISGADLPAALKQLGLETDTGTLKSAAVSANHAPTSISLVDIPLQDHRLGSALAEVRVLDADGDARFTFAVSDPRFTVTGDAGAYHLTLRDGAALERVSGGKVDLSITATDAGGLSTTQAFAVDAAAPDTVTNALVLRPHIAESAGETHSALVVSDAAFGGQFSFGARVQTTEQLRVNAEPNPWEAGWVVWGYQDPQHFYYFTLKTNGWELGKIDPAYAGGQRFLATGDSTKLDIGAWNDFRIDVDGSHFAISIDGKLITTFTDSSGPLYTNGKIGFYSEDAEIRVDRVTAPLVDEFDSYGIRQVAEGGTVGPWHVVFNGYGNVSVGEYTTDDVPGGTETPNQAPTGITLSNASILENQIAGTIGVLTVADPDGAPTFGFTTSDSRFEVVQAAGSYQLKLAAGAALDYETDSHVPVVVTATDDGGLSVSKSFDIHVVDAPGVTIKGTSSADIIDGTHTAAKNPLPTAEGDTISGNGGDDTIHGLAGGDTLFGNSGNDKLYGDAGNDRLDGGAGTDTISGGEGADTIVITGTEGKADLFDGGAGLDTLLVTGTGAATLNGFNAAASSIEVWQGNNQGLLGSSGADTFDLSALTSVAGLPFVDGGKGNDKLTGSQFADTLRGGDGSDRITGNGGDDTLSGGSGTDTFVFAAHFGRDTVTDFVAGPKSSEIIEISKDVFADFAHLRVASHQVGADVVISATPSDSITLKNVSLTQLHDDDFRFF